jgi:hypothetical protein
MGRIGGRGLHACVEGWCGEKAKSRAFVAGSLLPGAQAKTRIGADALGLAA